MIKTLRSPARNLSSICPTTPVDYAHCTTPKFLSPCFTSSPTKYVCVLPCFCACWSFCLEYFSFPSSKKIVLLLPFVPRALGTCFSMLSITSQCSYWHIRLSPVLGYELLKGKRKVLIHLHNVQSPPPLLGLVMQNLKWYKDIRAYLWVLDICLESKIFILSLPEKAKLALVWVFT